MTGLPSRTTSVMTATTEVVISEKSKLEFLMSDLSGIAHSRMSTIRIGALFLLIPVTVRSARSMVLAVRTLGLQQVARLAGVATRRRSTGGDDYGRQRSFRCSPGNAGVCRKERRACAAGLRWLYFRGAPSRERVRRAGRDCPQGCQGCNRKGDDFRRAKHHERLRLCPGADAGERHPGRAATAGRLYQAPDAGVDRAGEGARRKHEQGGKGHGHGPVVTKAWIGCGRGSVRCRINRPPKDQSMTEAIETTTSKSRSKAAPPAAFEMPKFELPNFEMPKMEIPAAFREMAEKSVSQAKETYEKMKSAAEEATDVLEDTSAAATTGASDYGLKVSEAARANTNAAFDFATQLMTVKSLSEMVELSTAHTRKQFEALTAQSKELAAIAQKVATDSAEPVKESFGKVFKKVA